MTMTTGTGLRAAAVAAHAAWQEQGRLLDEERAAATREREASKLKAHLQRILGIDAEPTENKWTVDGISFFASGSWDNELYLSQPCPKCDSNLISYRIESLADVGAALDGHWQRHEHYYQDGSEKQLERIYAAPPTTEQVLIDAFRAFIADYTYQGGRDA